MNPLQAFWKTGVVIGLIWIAACKGDSHGPDFQPIPGLTGKLGYITGVQRTGYVEYQLRVLDLATGAIRTLYTAPQAEQILSVAWHPDGHSLAISALMPSASGPPDSRLLRVNEDGSGAFTVFDHTGPEFGGSYSPQGALAYCGGFTPNAGLFIDGVSAWPADCSSAASPSWFPDGNSVAMVAYVGGVLGLYRVDLATRTASSIVATPAPGNASGSDVSLQGDVIAAAVADAAGWKIQLIRLDGSGSSVLPGSEGGDSPQWSADASRIVYVRGFRPYVHELATGSVTRIIDAETRSVAWLE